MKDLVDSKSTDGMYYQSWEDDGHVYFTIGFITVSLPKEEFFEFSKYIANTNKELKKIK